MFTSPPVRAAITMVTTTQNDQWTTATATATMMSIPAITAITPSATIYDGDDHPYHQCAAMPTLTPSLPTPTITTTFIVEQHHHQLMTSPDHDRRSQQLQQQQHPRDHDYQHQYQYHHPHDDVTSTSVIIIVPSASTTSPRQ